MRGRNVALVLGFTLIAAAGGLVIALGGPPERPKVESAKAEVGVVREQSSVPANLPGPAPYDVPPGGAPERLPDKIPAGVMMRAIQFPTASPQLDLAPEDFNPPLWTAPDEAKLYGELRREGKSFRLVPGSDGYMHVVQP